MQNIHIKKANAAVPPIGIGCMRMDALAAAEAEKFIQTALEMNLYFFDHADIYGGGRSEEIFGKAIKFGGIHREKLFLQSKCGIRKGFWDFSKQYIIDSVDGILLRLGTDYLDMLLLHRPDALMEPEEVAEAFKQLSASGKVRNFGVSNQNPLQMELLQKEVKQTLAVNQLQLSVTNCGMIRSGMNVNMLNEAGIDRDGSILDYCRLHDITIQIWSPLQYGFFEGAFVGSPKFSELNAKLEEIGVKYGLSPTGAAIAWLLRHPAKMLPVVGTMNIERLKEIRKAADVKITREEWYEIYKAAGNVLP